MKRLFAIALTLLLLPLGMVSVASAFDETHVIYALPDEIVVEGIIAYQMEPGPDASYEIPAELSAVTIIPLKDNATFRCFDGTKFSFGKISDDTIGIFTLATSGTNPTRASLTITKKPLQDYTLTIDANDGSTAPTTVTQAMRSTYTLPVLERGGYSFHGWALSGGGGLSLSSSPVYTFGTGDGAVTAQWRKLVTIAYDTDGGSPALEPRILLSGVPDLLPSAPTKSGYTFTGWKAGDTIFAAGADYTVTGDMTFTAQWKAASEEPEEPQEDYVITNPYKDVIWSGDGAWNAYKGNLHTHTTFSDGDESLQAMVEEYYNQGYDVIANADHGVVSRPWNQAPTTVPILGLYGAFKDRNVLSAERLAEINAGEGRNGRGMIQVPKGIEMNAATVYKSHIVGLYGGWGQGWIGLSTDFRIPIAGTEKNGGVSFIAHPGDWLNSAGDIEIARDPANVNFFADILRDYESCLGMEIYNGGDGRTRYDRVLWDQILMRLMPEGIPVWGFANDDSHDRGAIGRTAEILFMPTNTTDNVRTCIETGAFLACTHRDIPLGIDGDRTKPYPGITNITVAEDGRSITLEADNYTEVTWITDNEEVVGDGLTVDLTNGKIKSYVRAQLTNPNGVTATQPFGVDKGDGYKHPDDAPQGLEKLQWTINLYLTKNVFGWAIENIAKLFK